MAKSSSWILISGFVGIFIFLLVYLVLEYMRPFVDSSFFDQLVDFLRMNLYVIMSFSLLMIGGDFFRTFRFPLNIPAPLLTACGSVFTLIFIYRIFRFMDSLFEMGLYDMLSWSRVLIIPLVFMVVIIVGYVQIFLNSQKAFSGHFQQRRQSSGRRGKGWSQQ